MKLIVVMVSLMTVPWMSQALADNDVSVQLSPGGQWKVTTAHYVATSGRTGYLGSLIVDGHECLAVSASGPSGSYLAAGQMPRLGNLATEGGNRITGSCSLADLAYTFTEDRVSLRITTHQAGVHLYMLLNPAVTRLEYMEKGGDVPTVTSVPATVRCKLSRWHQADTALVDVSGSDSMWMWHGHQLWDAALAQGETRTIEMAVASASAVLTAQPQDTSEAFTYADASVPRQIPLCMIGDSITWADHGDDWRHGLLELHPGFAFVGTHSAKQGYSHAGEGGNGTRNVISRLPEIPACPYYSLLIGTNDTNIRDAAQVADTAAEAADRIIKIVSALLQKEGVRRVFLCSLLPCHTDNPLRDQTNAAVNAILRDKLAAGLFADKPVTWVELEKPLRALPGWEKLIPLHPTTEGYRHIAKLHGEAILAALAIKDHAVPVAKAGTGVRVVNLWEALPGFACDFLHRIV